MAYVMLGIAGAAGLVLAAQWLAHANTRTVSWLLKILGGTAVVAAIALIVLAERFQWIAYAVPLILPVWFNWRSGRFARRGRTRPSRGRVSELDTHWLHVTLDHDSGAMDGTVRAGRYAGRALSAMTLEELRELRAECAGDADSLRVLDAFLDRVHPDWRDGAEAGPRAEAGASAGTMTREEALEILGLPPDAGPEQVRDAHRRLVAKLHPDRGGSTWLAAKLNQARDVLLDRG